MGARKCCKKTVDGWNKANDSYAYLFFPESINRGWDNNDPMLSLRGSRVYEGSKKHESAAPAQHATTASSLERKPSKSLMKAPWLHRRTPTTLEGTRSGGVVRKA